ncbi:MAG: hypothetical protein AAF732_21105, partial [Pseudomonadota bacterium]
MSISRRTYTARDKTRTAKRYTIDFADHNRIRRRLPGFADKASSVELERKIAKLCDCRAANDTPPAELVRFVDALPAAMRGTLAKWGILDPRRIAAAVPLIEHAAAFREHLLDSGRTEQHARDTFGRCARVIAGCRFRTA